MNPADVSVVIPALNEEEPIADVVRACLATGLPNEVIVVDNGSTDRTAECARKAGARVVSEPTPGYGRACAAGVRAISPNSKIVVFLDGDGSDCPELMDQLVRPIAEDRFDFVIGSRTRGEREHGSMNFQQVLSGRVAGFLLRLLRNRGHVALEVVGDPLQRLLCGDRDRQRQRAGARRLPLGGGRGRRRAVGRVVDRGRLVGLEAHVVRGVALGGADGRRPAARHVVRVVERRLRSAVVAAGELHRLMEALVVEAVVRRIAERRLLARVAGRLDAGHRVLVVVVSPISKS